MGEAYRPRRSRTAALVALAVVALVALVAAAWASGLFGGGNGGTSLPSTPPTSLPGPPSIASTSPAGLTIAAVGDSVCDPRRADEDGDGNGPRQCRQQAVSDLLVQRHPAALLALGDNQYSDGTLEAYRTMYAPTFGRLLDVTYPVPGNHEYQTPHAAGYFGYFGARAGSPDRGYYSYDLGGWHVVALNSNCDEVPCAAGGAQERWLRADLAAHPAACTLAYWHHPRWSHGKHGDNPQVAPLVQALDDGGVELLLTGHDHDYERLTPRAADGTATPDGVREFVVGTGGRDLRPASPGTGTESMDSDSFGALFLTLAPSGYRWNFVSATGTGFSDTGTGTCH